MRACRRARGVGVVWNRYAEVVGMGNAQTGKRYVCSACGAEFIVTKGGDAELKCCGKLLDLKK